MNILLPVTGMNLRLRCHSNVIIGISLIRQEIFYIVFYLEHKNKPMFLYSLPRIDSGRTSFFCSSPNLTLRQQRHRNDIVLRLREYQWLLSSDIVGYFKEMMISFSSYEYLQHHECWIRIYSVLSLVRLFFKIIYENTLIYRHI